MTISGFYKNIFLFPIKSILIFLNAPLVNFVEKEISLPLFNLYEIINLVINIAENKEVIIPIIKVVANPLIGPDPNIKDNTR